MGIYTFLYYSILITSILLFIKSDKKIEASLFIILSVFTILIVALRDISVGTDTINYVDFFQHPERGYLWRHTTEPFYNLINLFFHNLTGEYGLFITLSSLMYLIPVSILINKYSKFKIFSLFLFITMGTASTIYFLYFSMVRQAFATAFFILALISFIDNNQKINKKVFILSLLMILTHYSSIICLIVFFLPKISIKRVWAIVVILLTIALGYSISRFYNYLMILSTTIGKGFYFRALEETQFQIMTVLPMSLIVTTILITANREFYNTLLFKVFFLGVALNNIIGMVSNADRMNLYFLIMGIIVIPQYVKLKDLSWFYKVGIFLICISYFSYKYFKVLNYMLVEGTGNVIVPYESYLF